MNSGKISPTDAIPLPKGEILKSTQKLDSLNPTGGVFAKYTKTEGNINYDNTTTDKTIGKSVM